MDSGGLESEEACGGEAPSILEEEDLFSTQQSEDKAKLASCSSTRSLETESRTQGTWERRPSVLQRTLTVFEHSYLIPKKESWVQVLWRQSYLALIVLGWFVLALIIFSPFLGLRILVSRLMMEEPSSLEYIQGVDPIFVQYCSRLSWESKFGGLDLVLNSWVIWIVSETHNVTCTFHFVRSRAFLRIPVVLFFGTCFWAALFVIHRALDNSYALDLVSVWCSSLCGFLIETGRLLGKKRRSCTKTASLFSRLFGQLIVHLLLGLAVIGQIVLALVLRERLVLIVTAGVAFPLLQILLRYLVSKVLRLSTKTGISNWTRATMLGSLSVEICIGTPPLILLLSMPEFKAFLLSLILNYSTELVGALAVVKLLDERLFMLQSIVFPHSAPTLKLWRLRTLKQAVAVQYVYTSIGEKLSSCTACIIAVYIGLPVARAARRFLLMYSLRIFLEILKEHCCALLGISLSGVKVQYNLLWIFTAALHMTLVTFLVFQAFSVICYL